MLKYLLCILFLLPVAAVAQGPTTDVAVQIQPVIGNGHFCLDAEGNRDHDGVPVFIYACRGSENQHWTVTSSVNNQHAIIGIGGFCLDVRGNGAANGTPVQLWKCHFGDNQRFSLNPDGRIVEVRTHKCLIATAPRDRAPLVLDTCSNTPQEIFAIRH